MFNSLSQNPDEESRSLPYNLEAEASLLGNLLISNKLFDQIADVLKAHYFYSMQHAVVYLAMFELWSAGRTIDVLFVAQKIRDLGLEFNPESVDLSSSSQFLDTENPSEKTSQNIPNKTISKFLQTSGKKPTSSYIKQLLSSNLGAADYEFKLRLKEFDYSAIDSDFLTLLITRSSISTDLISSSKLIKEKYILRSILTVGDELKALVLNTAQPPSEVLDIAQKRLLEVGLDNTEKTFVHLYDALGQAMERITDLHANQDQEEVQGISTGFVDLDKLLGGFHKSDLIIVAARPSMGKTSMALEFVKNAAILSQKKVAMFSLEMNVEQLTDRLVASTAEVDAWKIKTGKYDDQDFMKIGRAMDLLLKAEVYFDDSGSANVLEIRSKARRLKATVGLDMIVIDYLQLMQGTANRFQGNRVQEVSEISRGLKMLAKELNIPVIALSQLSRGLEGRDDKRPLLSDLRESGSIEQDADIVMFIHREAMFNREIADDKKNNAELLVSKHRNGSTGTVHLAWVPHLATFRNKDGAKPSYWVEK